jgi:hypothetical protein
MSQRYKITAPVQGATCTVAGIALVNSVGETDNPGAVAYFKRHGYQVEEIAEAVETDATPEAEKPPAPPFAPNRGSSKAEWVAYLTSPNAGDKALTAADAEAKTRDQLAEHVLGPKEG